MLPKSGWINLFKPSGLSSAAASGKVRRLLFPGGKVGHAGTLDPLASGVLPLAFGSATRLVEYLALESKEYEFTTLFGQKTTTGDKAGDIIGNCDHVPSECEARDVTSLFLGKVRQNPPAFSAIKVNGVRAYAMARAGKEVSLPEREVFISSLELLSYSQTGSARYKVECSSGTYIRSLAEDIAEKLGTFGTVVELLRSRVGPFKSEFSVSLESVNKDLTLPLNFALGHMQCLEIDEEPLKGIKLGKSVLVNSSNSGLTVVCLKSVPVAVGNITESVFHPKKVLLS